MNSSISLTVPLDDNKALIAGATMLLTLAGKVPDMELDDAMRTVGMPDGTKIDTYQNANDGVVDLKDSTTTPPPETKTTTPPPAEEAVQLDSKGLPWDARIHAGTQALLADGSWRYKQGVDRAVLVPQIEAELRTLMDTQVGKVATTSANTVETTTPPPVADADVPVTFPEFLKAVSSLIGAGTTTMVAVNAILQSHGVATIQLVNARTDLIPAIWADLVGGSE